MEVEPFSEEVLSAGCDPVDDGEALLLAYRVIHFCGGHLSRPEPNRGTYTIGFRLKQSAADLVTTGIVVN